MGAFSDASPADVAARFNDSLERCSALPSFLAAFYERFVSASPEVAAHFSGTDLRRQASMLRASLYLAVYASFGRDEWTHHLERIAELHSRRKLDIEPRLYELWLECLLETVAEYDPEFGPEVADAWRTTLEPGIEFMKERY